MAGRATEPTAGLPSAQPRVTGVGAAPVRVKPRAPFSPPALFLVARFVTQTHARAARRRAMAPTRRRPKTARTNAALASAPRVEPRRLVVAGTQIAATQRNTDRHTAPVPETTRTPETGRTRAPSSPRAPPRPQRYAR